MLEALILSVCVRGSQGACMSAGAAYYMYAIKQYEEPLRKRYPKLANFGAAAAGLSKQTVIAPLNDKASLGLTVYPNKAIIFLSWKF